jgi:hypothetical protein
MSEEDMVVVEVTHGNKNFIVVSIYPDTGRHNRISTK